MKGSNGMPTGAKPQTESRAVAIADHAEQQHAEDAVYDASPFCMSGMFGGLAAEQDERDRQQQKDQYPYGQRRDGLMHYKVTCRRKRIHRGNLLQSLATRACLRRADGRQGTGAGSGGPRRRKRPPCEAHNGRNAPARGRA